MRAGSSLSTAGSEGEQFTEASIVQGILDLGQQVRSLLEETMMAFAGRDAEAARRLWKEDRVVDRGCYVVRRDLMAILEGAQAIPALHHDPHMLQRATCLLWIAHELERTAVPVRPPARKNSRNCRPWYPVPSLCSWLRANGKRKHDPGVL